MAKVLHISSGLGQGGAERFIYNLMTFADLNKHQHIVVSLTGDGYYGPLLAELGIEVIDVRVKQINLPAEVSNSIFQRMRAERTAVAKEHRSEGKEKAEELNRLKTEFLACLIPLSTNPGDFSSF